MKNKIEYIKKIIGTNGNVSIYTGKLTNKEIKKLSKHFKIENEPFGYTKFTNL